jgi:Raf kinase inhibitor-like YbhB/YbcL family protein
MSVRNKLLLAAGLLAGLITASHAQNHQTNGSTMKMQMTTTAFAEGQPIPRRHAYDDKNLSPALQWSQVLPAAKSLALICDDPDAPMGTWVHWVLYDLPPASTGLAEGAPNTTELPNGAKQGVNDFGRTGYGGPAPPAGKAHRYFFKLYALDINPDLKAGLTKKELLKAIEGHVLAEAQVMGTYQKK